MRSIFPIWYAFALVAALALLSIVRLNDRAILVLSFEGDAVHLAQVVKRMLAGDVPGQDFLTPLGAMAFLPIVWLVKAGLTLGAAIAYAPVLIGMVCLPAVWWLGHTRLPIAGAMAFGASFLLLLSSYLHGGSSPTVTLSMYYNNWGWALAMLVTLAAVTPGRIGDRWVVALVCGAGLAALALIKAPYAVFLLPAVVAALALHGRWAELIGGLAVGLLVLLAVTLPLGGLTYWQGYVADLLFVARSEVRANPGKDLVSLALSPGLLPAVLAWLAAVLFLRQAKRAVDALVLLLLGAGFIAITQQNWQNDPHWVIIFGLIVMALASPVTLYNRYGWPLRDALQVTGVVFLALGAPAIVAQGQSLLIHASLEVARFAPLLPDDQSLRTGSLVQKTLRVEVPHPGLVGAAERDVFLAGERLPNCQKKTGLVAELRASGEGLDNLVATEGRTAIYADWVNAIWLWSALDPLPGGAPWYYGGTPGMAEADYLIVPLCPMGEAIRAMVLREIEAAGLMFQEVARDDRMIVLQQRP